MFVTYTAVGVYLIILARNPMKYTVLVPFTGISAVLLGLACAITGLAVKMPIMLMAMVRKRARTVLPRLTSVITTPDDMVGGTVLIIIRPMARGRERFKI